MKQINMHTCRCNKIKIHSYDTLEVYDCSRCQNKLSKKFEEFCSLNSVFSYDIPDIITRQEVTVVQTCSSNKQKRGIQKLRRKQIVPCRKQSKHGENQIEERAISTHYSEVIVCNKHKNEYIHNTIQLSRISSDKPKAVQMNASYNDDKASLYASNAENEQQSSSVPNISCDLNCVNDERLDQLDFNILIDSDNKIFKHHKIAESKRLEFDEPSNSIRSSKIKLESHLSTNTDSSGNRQTEIRPSINNFTGLNASKFGRNIKLKLKELKPLSTQIQNIRNINRTNHQNVNKKQIRPKYQNKISNGYRKRVTLGKTFFNDTENYYNNSYLRQIKLEESPESAALPYTQLIDNSIPKYAMVDYRTSSDTKAMVKMKHLKALKGFNLPKAKLQSKFSVNTMDCISPTKLTGCYSTIQESVAHVNKRWVSPEKQIINNFPKLHRNLDSTSRNNRSIQKRINSRDSNNRFSPIKSKFGLSRANDRHINLNFSNQLRQLSSINSDIHSPVLRSPVLSR